MNSIKICLRRSSMDFGKKLGFTKVRSNGLHSALRLTLFCARIIGILPLTGLMNQNSSNIRFQLLSFYSIVYFVSLIGQTVMFAMSFYWLLESRVSLTNTTNFYFYTSSSISFLILANVSRRWPKLMATVKELEEKLPPLSGNTPLFCNLTVVIILFAALVEHLFSIFYGISVAKACDPNNIAETFFHYDKPWIFTYTTYTLWKGILIELFNIQSTFIWSYNDLIIMVISIYLTERFKLQNMLMTRAFRRGQYDIGQFRVQHLKIIKLVKIINETIGIYILNCFGSNLYWICTQLFYSMNKEQTGHFVSCELDQDIYNPVHGIEHTIYFTYSFSFLLVRTMLVLLLAARVHSASIVPLDLLYNVPSSRYDVEVSRFISQICNIKGALSGLDFFYVTRTMILTMLGTIVTYELVLLQFNK